MRTLNARFVAAPPARARDLVAQVERWPEWLSHYRWVRRLDGAAGGPGVVDMAAVRPFGRLRYPVWWRSRMWLEDEPVPSLRFRHIGGVTTGMDVAWRFHPRPGGCRVEILHEWDDGPRWPLPRALRQAIARLVIGPIFVHAIAERTLAGLARVVEASCAASPSPASGV